ncbi:c-type cytochrome [Roseomonas gilardii subsp. gilardii]|uniref:c-type cytochrome n=1 Tax=Roseomonas gilardii TaxID=257708 RepID=UPI001FFBE08B|nr:c-type cytochrome [Roseomonas gilardii]UPG74343.1 c-type cytochrome [Roseomonas gilardii subsp. gilardii]
MPGKTGTRRVLVGAAVLGCLAVLVLAVLPSGERTGRAGRETSPDEPVTALLADADLQAGARLFRQCAACHTISRGAPDLNGPNLHGIVGAPVAGNRPRYGYTHALRAKGGNWSVERLDAWLKDPSGFAPGTRMVIRGLSDARARADLIAYLISQGDR